MPAGETEQNPSPWTIDSTREHFIDALNTFREWVRDKFHSNEKAVETALAAHDRMLAEIDRRYQQRFVAQEQAVSLALARVDKEFHEHIAQVRTETKAALDAADKAIYKQETATEKRFESVNEFRGQLADQATRFMPRLESLQRHEQNAEKLDSLDKRFREETARINSRLDLTTGRGIGIEKGWSLLIGFAGLVGGIIAIIVTFAR